MYFDCSFLLLFQQNVYIKRLTRTQDGNVFLSLNNKVDYELDFIR